MRATRTMPGAALYVGASLFAAVTWCPDPEAPPDRWGPFQNRRVVSPSGRHYAVLRSPTGVWPGPFELVRRRAGVTPIEPALERSRFVEDSAGGRRREKVVVDRDPEDGLVASGLLPQLPMDAAVVDEPLGIVLFDQYAHLGRGRVLCFLDREGHIAWSWDLTDLYGGDPEGSAQSVSSTWWSAAWGVDGELGVAWALSMGGEFRAVALGTGEISTPGAEVLANLCAGGTDHARIAVMDAVLARDDLATKPLLPLLVPVAVDDEQALAVRLRAAVLCRRAGDRVDHAGLFRAAATDEDLDSAIFAALYLPWFVDGEDAIAPLAAALARLDEPLEPRAHLRAFLPASRRLPGFVAAFRAQGEPGLARLRELLESGDVSPTARISLCVIWWQLGQSGLPDGLRTMICSGDPVDANLALNAMIYSEPEDLTGILLGLARDGTADDVRLAMYFDDHPHPDAVAPLERMLAEPREDREARWIRQALDACRR